MRIKSSKIIVLLAAILVCGLLHGQSPVIHSESNITMVSPGVYRTWNCANIQTDVWTDSIYSNYSWSTGQTVNRITVNGFGGSNPAYSPYYSLTLTVTDGQGNTNSSVVVMDSLNALGANPQIGPYGPTTVCAGNVVTLGVAFSGSGEQLIWTNGHVVNTLGDCDWSFQGTCFEEFTTSGNHGFDRIYTFTGCHYPQSMPVGVFAYPAAPTISQSHDTLFASGGAPSYRWYDNTQTLIPGVTTPWYHPTAAGTYYAKANGSFAPGVECLSSSSTGYVFSLSSCFASYAWAPDTSGQYSILAINNCTPTPGNGGSYFWDFGDGNSSTQAYPQHQYSGAGNYNVCVTVNFNGCAQTYCDTIIVLNKVNAPFTINVVDPNAVAVQQTLPQLQAHITPNPAEGKVVVSFQLPENEFISLRVLGLNGQEIYRSNPTLMQAGTQSLDFDGSEIAQGIYFLELKVGENLLRRKLVMQ